MKLDVTVKNLGQIKQATFQVRPVTVITGPNGTGKSFFTKTLYSILNIVNINVYYQAFTEIIQNLLLFLDYSFQTGNALKGLENKIKQLSSDSDEVRRLNGQDIAAYFSFANSRIPVVESIYQEFLTLLGITSWKDVSIMTGFYKTPFDELLELLKTPINYIARQIGGELKDNFQVSALTELTRFGEKKTEIEIHKWLTIEIKEEQIVIFTMAESLFDNSNRFSSVVFLESPAYWRVRDALKLVKNYAPGMLHNSLSRRKDVLNGVPKYFYELDEALSVKIKSAPTFTEASQRLKDVLGGEFIIKGDELSFKNDAGHEISKNLVSLGMTNLGIIHALLKQNLLTAGSFVFIDEPETNLHPDWQVKLVDVLLLLAKAGVNVVMTTHSQDFAKALEVCIKKIQLDAEALDDFLSVHYLDHDGQLYRFESDNKLQQLIEARELLSMAYQELYFSDLH